MPVMEDGWVTTDDLDAFRRLGAAFARGGDRYQRLRPGYPDDVVDWLVAGVPDGGRAVDVGAGTGKLTTALVARGFEVEAVDPSPDMLAQLRQQLPSVRLTVGSGEDTHVETGTADLVTFAQSWHWIEPAAGAAEIQRILKPSGRVSWVWNFLDVRVPWVAELADIWHTLAAAEATDATRHAPILTSAFEPVESRSFDWQQRMSRSDLAALVTTRSYYLNAPESTQRELRERADSFLAGVFPDGDDVDLPYLTHCYRTRLATGGPR